MARAIVAATNATTQQMLARCGFAAVETMRVYTATFWGAGNSGAERTSLDGR
jgi:hypothetical protein